jgi:hypothetical protein
MLNKFNYMKPAIVGFDLDGVIVNSLKTRNIVGTKHQKTTILI